MILREMRVVILRDENDDSKRNTNSDSKRWEQETHGSKKSDGDKENVMGPERKKPSVINTYDKEQMQLV